MNLRKLYADLADACRGLGFNVYDQLPGNPEFPAVVVGWPSRIDINETLAGGSDLTLPIVVAFARADDAQAQADLYELLEGPLARNVATARSNAWVAIDASTWDDIGSTTTPAGVEVLTATLTVQLITTP